MVSCSTYDTIRSQDLLIRILISYAPHYFLLVSYLIYKHTHTHTLSNIHVYTHASPPPSPPPQTHTSPSVHAHTHSTHSTYTYPPSHTHTLPPPTHTHTCTGYTIAETAPGFIQYNHPETVLLLHTSGTSGNKKLVPYSLDMVITGKSMS